MKESGCVCMPSTPAGQAAPRLRAERAPLAGAEPPPSLAGHARAVGGAHRTALHLGRACADALQRRRVTTPASLLGMAQCGSTVHSVAGQWPHLVENGITTDGELGHGLSILRPRVARCALVPAAAGAPVIPRCRLTPASQDLLAIQVLVARRHVEASAIPANHVAAHAALGKPAAQP